MQTVSQDRRTRLTVVPRPLISHRSWSTWCQAPVIDVISPRSRRGESLGVWWRYSMCIRFWLTKHVWCNFYAKPTEGSSICAFGKLYRIVIQCLGVRVVNQSRMSHWWALQALLERRDDIREQTVQITMLETKETGWIWPWSAGPSSL